MASMSEDAPGTPRPDAGETDLQQSLSASDLVAMEEGHTNISNPKDIPTPASAHHATMLIKALQSIIYGHINVPEAGPDIDLTSNAVDGDENHLGAEAQELIAALQKFIGVTVRSESRSPREHHKDEDEDNSGISLDTEETISPSVESDADSGGVPMQKLQIAVIPRHRRSPLLLKALDALRYHVFNKMPIRLLAFNPADGSGIELLERGAIYGRLSSTLEATFNEANVKFQIQSILSRNFWGRSKKLEVEKHVIDGLIAQHAPYAILSHTWIRETPGEVTYGQWRNQEFDTTWAGYRKLANFCRIAAADHGVSLGWMDTVCINKESSAELDESIRSMYKWYSDAHICITYLAQTASLGMIYNDAWFTRGWTLQELLAPQRIKFYGVQWNALYYGNLDDKTNKMVQKEIQRATTITPHELNQIRYASFRAMSISRRMQLAASRQVTREEDSAYALMGLFKVSMSTAYGEGAESAFLRLVKEILGSSKVDILDIVNWGGFDDASAQSLLIPSTSAQYLRRWEFGYVSWPSPTTPIALTHLGLHLPVLLMPAISSLYDVEETQLEATDEPFVAKGAYRAIADIGRAADPRSYRDIPKVYNVLDQEISGPDGWTNEDKQYQITFGVLNATVVDEDLICLPVRCFAVGLYFSGAAGEVVPSNFVRKIQTEDPIVFDLQFNDENTTVENCKYITCGVLTVRPQRACVGVVE